jgi:septal ring factor EnvC (AmiA/AmiB activator)
VDQEGNPAEGFMQKATAWMQKRFPKLFAEESINPMTKKVLACLCALLAVQDFEVNDGKITITEEDADKVEGQLDQLGKDLQAAKDAQADLQAKLDKALQDVQQRDQQIANLKKSAGVEDTTSPGEKGNGVQDINSAAELFNSVNVD